MNQPSSTITAAFLAGNFIAILWLIYEWLQLGPPAPAALVSASTAWVAAVVGYAKRETVYTDGVPWTEGTSKSPAVPPEDKQ